MMNTSHPDTVLERLCPLALLERDSERLIARGERVQVIFDLDDTLFLVRSRKRKIFQEMAVEQAALPEVAASLSRLASASIPFDVGQALDSVGIARMHHGRLISEFFNRFFDGAYLVHDTLNLGAADFVARLGDLGVGIVYLSGRPANMLPQTAQILADAGFPVHAARTKFLLKGQAEAHLGDVEFKARKAEELVEAGRCVGVFDNEPANLNAVHQVFPGAHYYLLETDCAPAPPPLAMTAHRLVDFTRGRARLSAAVGPSISRPDHRWEITVQDGPAVS
ncbi:MAG: HAD family hydrolase [Candidatus Sericytochromatia bacterium]|nr:HAD family hydrolase [Candidatus Sericytochromatia bacterium]